MILDFDFTSPIPLYQQLRNQIIINISQGKLKTGEKLPTVRALADESGINSMTVSKAYQLLKQEGYIITDRRSGTVVSMNNRTNTINKEDEEALKLLLSQLHLSGMTKDNILNITERLYAEVVK